MKLLIASDLHGSAPAVRKLARRVEAECPDKILLLGDLLYHGPRNTLPNGYDSKEVFTILNSMADKIIAVRGNCDSEVDQMVLDFSCQDDFARLEADGHLLHLSHGHLAHNNPNFPPDLPSQSAFLSGHTHVKRLALIHNILFVNPGSTSIPKDGIASYATYENETFYLKTLDGETLESATW